MAGHHGILCSCELHFADQMASPALPIVAVRPTGALSFRAFLDLVGPLASPLDLAKIWRAGARTLEEARSALRKLGGACPESFDAAHSSAQSSQLLRPDHPTVFHASRGSRDLMQLRLATEACRLAALADIDELTDAHTATRTAQERWETWQTALALYSESPLPVTYDKVRIAAAALRAGGYRDARPYLERVKMQHLKFYERPVGPLVELACRTFCRAVSRGVGPSKLKHAFDVHQLRPEQSTGPTAISSDMPWPITMASLCSWWLLRGIEASAARVRDWRLNAERKTITWVLPVSKTDVKALGKGLTHRCLCADRTDLAAICPYHTASHYFQLLHDFYDNLSEDPEDFGPRPLFPCSRGGALSKPATIRAFRSAAASTGTELTQNLAGSTLQRFGEHSCRVSGAQFMSSQLSLDLYLIQLYGRWSSSAITRYVQDAPLAALHLGKKPGLDIEQIVATVLARLAASDESDALTSTLELLAPPTDAAPIIPAEASRAAIKDQVDLSRAIAVAQNCAPRQHLVLSGTKMLHEIALGPEDDAESSCFLTACGWPFGLTNYQLVGRSSTDPSCRPCKKCAKSCPSAISMQSEDPRAASSDGSSSSD